MAMTIAPTIERLKGAVRVLRGGGVPRLVTVGERKVMPLIWPDFRADNPEWHLIDLENYVKEGFAGNALIYAAIMYKARALMQVPLRAYRGAPSEPEMLAPDEPLAELCARPNFHQSFPEMSVQATIYLNVAGNCYFLFDRPKGGGLPDNIFCLRPDRVHILPSKNKRQLIGYIYTPENVSWRDGIPILPQDMMHVKLPNPSDPLEGMGEGLSPIAPMAKSADVDNDITDFLKRFFERGVMLPGILSTDTELDDVTLSRIKERWKEIYGGYQAWAEEIGVLDVGTKYQRIGLSFDEMGLDGLDERSETRVLMPFGVPPILLGTRVGLSRSTYQNYKEARRQCWEDTLVPELSLYEREWQYYLRGGAGEWVAYDMTDVPALQQDKVPLVDAAYKLWTMGVPANQAVTEVGLTMEPIPGGDTSYLPFNLMPAGVRASPVAGTGPAPSAEEEERQETPKKAAGPSAQVGEQSRLTPEAKMALAMKADRIAWQWTPAFTRVAREQFETDFRELSAGLTAARNKSLQEKATINWQWLLREWTEILATFGERWREAFLPAIEGLIEDQGESLNLEFGVQWNVRNLFAEDWFTEYTMTFAENVTAETGDWMNGLLQQGMREGWSIPTMQRHLEQTFRQWQGQPVSGATWEWLEERVPPNRTELIARTETIRASARGSQGLYKAWGVERKQWLATPDDRECPWCFEMDGRIIDIGEPYFEKGSTFPVTDPDTGKTRTMTLNYEDVEGPPLHPNCRCALMPVVPDEGLEPEIEPAAPAVEGAIS